MRRQQIGVGLPVRTAHPPAQLMQLRQPELVRPVDEDGVGVGDVDAVLDDGGANQQVQLAAVEAPHHGFQFALAHLPVADADARLRRQGGQFLCHPLDGAHFVMHIEDLAAAQQFPLDGLPNQAAALFPYEGPNGQAAGRRRGDDRQIANAAHGHVQGAGDGRGGQRQHIHLRPQRPQPLLLANAEAMLLVDDDQPQVCEAEGRAQQLVGADQDVQLAGRQPLPGRLQLALAAQPRGRFDLHRPVRKAVPKTVEMLLDEQGGGRQHRHLLAGQHRGEGGPHGHFGLAEPHIAADQPVCRPLGAQVVQSRADGLRLIRRQLEGELAGEALAFPALEGQGRRAASRSAGIQIQQFRGHIRGLLRGPALGFLPLLRT